MLNKLTVTVNRDFPGGSVTATVTGEVALIDVADTEISTLIREQACAEAQAVVDTERLKTLKTPPETYHVVEVRRND